MMDYLRQLFSLIFAVSVMYLLLDCTEKLKKYRYAVGLYAAVVFICDAVALYKMGYASFMKFYPLLVHLPVFLGFACISSFRPIKVFFVHWTLVAIATSFTSVAIIISYFFHSSKTLINCIVYILYLPSWFAVNKFVRPTFLYMMRNAGKGWFSFCLIPITYSTLIYSIGMYSMDTVITGALVEHAVLFFILGFTAYYMIFKLFKQTRQQFIMQSEQDLLLTQVSAARAHLDALKESQETITLYRHDMRHHLSLIDACLADNNKEAAQKYIAQVESAIEDTVVEKYCGNYTVNLILSSYIAKAQNEAIQVETHIDLPEKNHISDMDLCVIFANAIENATNACKKIPLIEDRTLSIICKTRNDKLLIQIANSYAGEIRFVDEMPVSTIENHGLGTKSIAVVTQKYGGIYSFDARDNVFNTCIIL